MHFFFLGTRWDKNFLTIVSLFESPPAAISISSSSLRFFKSGNCGGALLETDCYVLNPVAPSSLTFSLDVIVSEINGTFVEKHDVLGAQENALHVLSQDGGGEGLTYPTKVHKLLEFAGLTENRIKKAEHETTLSIKEAILEQDAAKKRKCILDTALRFGKLPKMRAAFLSAARNELAGVARDFVHQWATKRVFKLKQKLDNAVGYLFVDVEHDASHVATKLFAIENQLQHLHTVLCIFNREQKVAQFGEMVAQGAMLNIKYTSTIRWLIQRRILPEATSETEAEFGKDKITWQYSRLNQQYDTRRRQILKYVTSQDASATVQERVRNAWFVKFELTNHII